MRQFTDMMTTIFNIKILFAELKIIVVAFRSPRTKGTNDTVKKATKQGFKVFVVDYD